MELNLADLKSVRNFADNFKIQFNQLDLLINNASVMMPPYCKAANGFELQFAASHLGWTAAELQRHTGFM